MWDADVLVVGGGISGLACAWWLRREGLEVELWERESRLGGKIGTDRDAGYTTERAAALVLNFRREVDQLIHDLALEDCKLRRATGARRYVVHEEKLVPVPSRLGQIARSPLLDLRGKLRLLAEPFVARGAREDETVSEFVTRRLGRNLLETMLEPYIAGPLAADPDRAEAWAALPRLIDLEQRFGSLAAGVAGTRLWRRNPARPMESFSFRGGMSSLIDALARTPGTRMRRRQSLGALEPERGGWRAAAHGGTALRARHVVLAIPAGDAAAVLAPLDPSLAALLGGIEYAPLAVAHLGFRREQVGHPLDGTGVLIPRRERTAPTGCLWTSALFPERAPAGRVLLDFFLGGARSPHAAHWDEERCVAECLRAMRGMLRLVGEPEMVRIDRHEQGLPLCHRPYRARLRAIDAGVADLTGIHLAGNYRGGVSVRDRILRAHELAGAIACRGPSRAPLVHRRPRHRRLAGSQPLPGPVG